jgi:lysozyme
MSDKMKVTKTSAAGIALIKKFESFSAKPYPDPGTGGKPFTIGFGSTYYEDGRKVTMSDPPLSEDRATQLLMKMLEHYEQGTDSLCRDDIKQNQFDALVSFAYNVGVNNLKSSTLLKKVNANPLDATIRDEFMRWNKAAGRVMKGLTRRRGEEADLYFKA